MTAQDAKRAALPPYAIVSSAIWNSRKVRRAGAYGALVFIFALTKNAAHGRTGRFPASELDVDHVADQLRLAEDLAREGVSQCVKAELLAFESGFAHVVGWDDDWARRTLSESEKRSLRRTRSQAQGDLFDGPDSVRVTSGQGPDSGPACPDRSILFSSPSSGSSLSVTAQGPDPDSNGKAKSRRRTRMPTDFRPAGPFPDGVDVESELAKFADHHAAKGSVFADWHAAWRNWMRNAESWGRTTAARATGVLRGNDAMDLVKRKIAEAEAEEAALAVGDEP